MKLVRVGDKLIDRDKIVRRIDEILEMRSNGQSQIDVAKYLEVDRTFISRLESLGEVVKGGKIALVGFPIGNRAELERVAFEEGVEFTYLLTEEERLDLVAQTDGATLVNNLLELISTLKNYDTIIFLASNFRSQFAESIIGKQVLTIEIGKSPITEDVEVDAEEIRTLIREIRRKEEKL
ncbi:MAG TPA: transcriptional regulator [Firmicutes bacterium]|nr:transcriptional regulator [Bacillota bacterium]